MDTGYLALVLHAHLPYVRHPEHEEFLEEDWLYEAVTETYLPLLTVFEGLLKDGIDFKVTVSLSPTLIAMLSDPLLRGRLSRRLEKLIELSAAEIHRTAATPSVNALARMYNWRFTRALELYENTYRRDLVSAFARLADEGAVEIITSTATHGYLPLLAVNEAAVRAQVRVACDFYRRTFGRPPRGMWLPEMGYCPGVEKILRDEGILYFFTDAHGVLHSRPRPRYGVFAPIYTDEGVAVFGRDMESGRQVWSAKVGYPGDPCYRDFYRDIGFDLEFDYIKPYIQPNGHRKMTGIKYYRITSGAADKEVYDHAEALRKASEHAADFLERRVEQARKLKGLMDRPPVIVSPYDAELFGHWWNEGPEFLNFLFRKLHHDGRGLRAVTPYEYLKIHPVNQKAEPAASSWGYKGHSEVWLDESNDWIYRHLHKAADRMTELASSRREADGVTRRALNQAARELLLAQSSDWAFIMKTGTMAPYAEKRTKEGIARFTRLYGQIMNGEIDEGFLEYLEGVDNIFSDIDYSVYADNASGSR
ncbi:MAG: glycoside hydrolase family 57 protein [Candidatus Nitrospinota bacterium M3_3B_026]